MSMRTLWRPLSLLTLAVSLSACTTLPTRLPVHAETAPTVTTTPLDPQTLSGGTVLVVGQSQQFHLYVSGQEAGSGQLNWVSSDPGVVQVSRAGLFQAVGPGQATVRGSLRSSAGSFMDFPVTVQAASTPSLPTAATTAYAQQVLALTNAARSQARSCGGAYEPAAPPLSLNTKLSTAAQGHASDMARHNYFSHTSQDGRTLAERINDVGYSWSSVGENIAAGQPTPEAVVAGWLASPGHCANLMNANLSQMGLGYATGGSYGAYWVQDFGRAR
ncbi:CAP domain-containing protein [Deinococcus irradiatisoli]|uniref:CAP domain-containing protein n=1 Tax=Deinococcus irradiatisoli TaxID=2202254 RepID=A0A2Z3JF75_9DEIO|nr:CAP domain-containing protein [Deinococcus irradiatisoli]AWN23615.1 CAP domain-containing protein [Deinococcus irradiatisoli]